MILDTTAETGSSEGLIRREEMEGPLAALFDRGVMVVASHHGLETLTDGSGGTKQDDAVTPDQWREFLHPHVLFDVAAHTHAHRVRFQKPMIGRGFWEIPRARWQTGPVKCA